MLARRGQNLRMALAAEGPPAGLEGSLQQRAQQLIELEKHFADEARKEARPQLPGFNVDSPPLELPDYISGSLLSDVLLAMPELYNDSRRAVTRGGVPFAQCIKPGIDLDPRVAAQMAKEAPRRFESERTPIGLIAGDDECYTAFSALFDEVGRRIHAGRCAEGVPAQPVELEPRLVRETRDLDPEGKFVVSTTVELRRSLSTILLPPGANTGDRREVESVVTAALCGSEEVGEAGTPGLQGLNSGEYWPLHDSWSYVARQGGMSEEQAAALEQIDQLFGRPEALLDRAAGLASEWPDARGVFCSDDQRLFVRINESDHFRIFVTTPSADVQGAFARLSEAMGEIEAGLELQGHSWSRHPKQGFLTASPAHVGTGGFRCTATIRVPLLARWTEKDTPNFFRTTVKRLQLEVRYVDGGTDSNESNEGPIQLENELSWRLLEVRNRAVQGFSAAALAAVVAAGVSTLLRLENALQFAEEKKALGQDPTMEELKFQTILAEIACADRDGRCYDNALAPIQGDYACPLEMPATIRAYAGPTPTEAAEAHAGDPEEAQIAVAKAIAARDLAARPVNKLAAYLRAKPRAYNMERKQITSLGVPYGLCVRPGINYPYDTSGCGFVAGDEESYTLFGKTANGVIEAIHGVWGEGRRHVSALDPLDYQFQMRKTDLDPRHVLQSRIRATRNLRGHRFAPACDALERRAIEAALVKALSKCGAGNPIFTGNYHPLHGSMSWSANLGGETLANEEAMRDSHVLFEKPVSAKMMAGGFHREWPDARGVFCNTSNEFIAWINERDHLRLITNAMGSDLQTCFLQFCEAHALLEAAIKDEGLDFVRTDRHGYVSADPRNIGTALKATVLLKLPLLGVHPEYPKLCEYLHLESSHDAIGGPLPDGLYIVGNSDRLRTDLQLVNVVIDGVEKLVQMEKALGRGESLNNVAFAIRTAHEANNIYPVTPPFPATKCPDTIPDLLDHHNLMARAMHRNPGTYHKFKRTSTKMGVPFARCIKTGVDIKGEYGTKLPGLVAGDEESYYLFRELFDDVIELRHGLVPGVNGVPNQVNDLDVSKVRNVELDPEGKYIISTQVRTARNLAGHKLAPAVTQAERRRVEQLLVKALLGMGTPAAVPRQVGAEKSTPTRRKSVSDKEQAVDEYKPDKTLQGKYYPLAGSTSGAQLEQPVAGMTEKEVADFTKNHLLFGEPSSEQLVASGFHHDWPDARGVFLNGRRDILGWLNQEDHLRLMAMEMGGAVKKTFARMCSALREMETVLTQLSGGGTEGNGFMRSERLGYFSTCPANLGTGLRVRVILQLPLLSARDDFESIVTMLRLTLDQGPEGVADVSNMDHLGRTEVELANNVISAVEKLLALEHELEESNLLGVDSMIKEIETAHATGTVYGSSHFPEDDVPLLLPDLSAHENACACVLREKPELYAEHRTLATEGGIGLGRLIKPGMHHTGVPRMSGMVAGDESSYVTFKRLFNPVIERLHHPFICTPAHLGDRHISNLNPELLLATPIDPKGRYVISSRIRAARNIRHFKLAPAVDAPRRRELEQTITRSLGRLTGDLQGDYFPLSGSESYALKPGGMAPDQEAELRASRLLFETPTSPALVAGGYHKDWPDARGLFSNDQQDLIVWVNEKDHMRIITTEDGADLQHAFQRFCNVVRQIENVCKMEGAVWMHSETLGYLTTDPANLGTGMRASVMMRLPLLTMRADFVDLVQMLRLEVREVGQSQWETTGDFPPVFEGRQGADGEGEDEDEYSDEEANDDDTGDGPGAVCISNLDRLGRTEVELVNVVTYGAARLVEMEELLSEGEELEPTLKALAATQRRAETGFAYVFSSEHSTLAKQPELSDAERHSGGDGREGGGGTGPPLQLIKPPSRYREEPPPPPVALPSSPTAVGEPDKAAEGETEEGSQRGRRKPIFTSTSAFAGGIGGDGSTSKSCLLM